MTCGGLSLNFTVKCGLVTYIAVVGAAINCAFISEENTERAAVFGTCWAVHDVRHGVPSTGFISFVNVGRCDLRVIASLVGSHQDLIVSASFSGKTKTINGDPQQLRTCSSGVSFARSAVDA